MQKLLEVEQEDLNTRDKVLSYLSKKKIDPEIMNDIKWAFNALFETQDDYFALLDKLEQLNVPSTSSVKTEALEVHNELNPKLWTNDGKLKPEILARLMDIAEEFINYIDIPINIADIQIVGSNVSYNYNENSDLDLHFIVNFELTYIQPEILQQLYNAKKSGFNDKYDLSINGIPVEVYIEDINAGNATNGRYSIIEDDWIVKPKPITYDIPDISNELNKYKQLINDALKSTDYTKIENLINEIYMNRKLGLAEQGEASVGNLVFKELRNMNVIQKLRDRYFELKSKELSL